MVPFRQRAVRWAIIAWVAAWLYVLSVGPAAWCNERSDREYQNLLMCFYAPLVWLSENNTWMGDRIEDYVEFFVRHR